MGANAAGDSWRLLSSTGFRVTANTGPTLLLPP